MFQIFRKLLSRLKFSKTICDEAGQPYLRRFYIFECRWGNVYLHQILRSDGDRDLHDHPWDFTSIILKGGYTEVNRVVFEDGTTANLECWWEQGDIIRHRAEDAHRLILEPNTTTWTLVFTGPKRREWGFHTPSGWLHWVRYLDIKFGAGNWTEV